MKTIGLIGGMSWESTTTYYQIINREVKNRLGGLHSAKIVLYSFDFEEVADIQRRGDWEEAARVMVGAAKKLESAGSDCLLICTNTMHKLADEVGEAVRVPLLHIADATASSLKAQGIKQVGLLGTRFTMEQDFYRERLKAQGLNVTIPDSGDRDVVHSIIYDELCQGKVLESSRARYVEIITRLGEAGCEAIVLGCTEIGLLIGQSDSPLPVYDTTEIHALAAANFALA